MVANKTCPACGETIAAQATNCPFCRSEQTDVGAEEAWQRAAANVQARQSDRADPTPLTIIFCGILLALATGLLAGVVGLDTTAGLVIALVGGVASQVVLLVGVIAKGVEIGNRASS